MEEMQTLFYSGLAQTSSYVHSPQTPIQVRTLLAPKGSTQDFNVYNWIASFQWTFINQLK